MLGNLTYFNKVFFLYFKLTKGFALDKLTQRLGLVS